MVRRRLRKRAGELVARIEAFAALPEELRQSQSKDFDDAILADARSIYCEILTVEDEVERNKLFDNIIQAFKNAGLIASTVKTLVDLFC